MLWKIRAGMTLYDLMAGWKHHVRHRVMSPEEVVAAEPAIDPTNLRAQSHFTIAKWMMPACAWKLSSMPHTAEQLARITAKS